MTETKQVPVEPTEFMLDEGRMALSRNGGEGTPEQLISDCQVVYKAMLAAAPAIDHPAHTHCANCGCTWLDNGLNPAWCPYCKATEPSEVERLAVCEWRHIENEGAWASGCGEYWMFTDGGPAENRYKFCHGCGKPVRVKGESDA